VRPDAPATFRLSLHVTFADATQAVSGRVRLTGTEEVVATDFVAAP
jgi:hypothetical protein